MRFDPTRIEHIHEIDYRVEEKPWRFAIDEAEAVDRHWAKLTARNPRLYNGRVFLMHRMTIDEEGDRRILRGAALEADYKSFIAWRDFGAPDSQVCNCFAMAALVSGDGAFVLGRMGAHTSNAGMIYFPSGTPDPQDRLVDGTIDLAGSVLRELTEETGLGPQDVAVEPDWTIVLAGQRVACMRRVRSALAAADIKARFAAFAATDLEAELDGLHAVFSESDFDLERMPDFTLTYLREALSRGAATGAGARSGLDQDR
jgi:8-oxo-dGTP pyrophosphatase MutT (NUDIX family)